MIEGQSPGIKAISQKLADAAELDLTQSSQGRCVECRQPFSDANVFTEAGRREAAISGMCEKCFDSIFEGDEL